MNSKLKINKEQEEQVAIQSTLEIFNVYKESGYDPLNRIIYMWGEIGPDLSYHFISSINTILQFSDSTEPITVYITSFGGDVYDMFHMVDYMRYLYTQKKIKINIYAGGKIMSAAAYLTISATGKRMVFPHTAIMLHEVQSYSGYDNTSKKRDDLQHTIDLEDKIINILTTKTKKKKAEFWKKEIEYKDKIYSPDDAIKLGLIDGMLL